MPLSPRTLHPDAKWTIMLVCITALALLLRLWQLGSVPFQHGDDASVAWATTWYFPRGIESFRTGDGSVDPNPLGIVTLSHGPLQVIIAAFWVTLINMFGFPITELSWHLPFALLGAAEVPMVFVLCSSWKDKSSGLLAATFVAILPLHVAFSRTSGESHYVLGSLLQVASLYMWHCWLLERRSAYAFAAGLLVAGDVLTDFAFPGLLLTLVFFGWLTNRGKPGAFTSILGSIFRWQFIVPVLAAVSVHLFGIARTILTGQPAGMFGRVAEANSGIGGFFVQSVLENLVYASSPVLVVAAVISALAYLWFRPARTLVSGVALFWAVIYLLPFLILFQRERLVGHFISPSVASCIFLTLIIAEFWTIRKFRAVLVIGVFVIASSLLASTLGLVFHVSLTGTADDQHENGSIGLDQGTKAAAWWVRNYTDQSAVVFTDTFASITQTVALYYFHRPIVSQEYGGGTTPATSRQLLMDNLDIIRVIVISEENLAQMPPLLQQSFQVSANVNVVDRPSLVILVRRGALSPTYLPMLLDTTTFNRKYDDAFANLSAIVTLPFIEIQTTHFKLP